LSTRLTQLTHSDNLKVVAEYLGLVTHVQKGGALAGSLIGGVLGTALGPWSFVSLSNFSWRVYEQQVPPDPYGGKQETAQRERTFQRSALDRRLSIINWFTEGVDTADLKDAKSLLEQLENRVALTSLSIKCSGDVLHVLVVVSQRPSHIPNREITALP
jgi:hypothetical protein